jgi:hypothetical protein
MNENLSFAEAINALYEEEQQVAAYIKAEEDRKAAIIQKLKKRKETALKEAEDHKEGYRVKLVEAAAANDALNSILYAKQVVNVKFYCNKCKKLLETSKQSYSTKTGRTPRDISRAYFGSKPCADCVNTEEIAKAEQEVKKAARVERFGPFLARFIGFLSNSMPPRD